MRYTGRRAVGEMGGRMLADNSMTGRFFSAARRVAPVRPSCCVGADATEGVRPLGLVPSP